MKVEFGVQAAPQGLDFDQVKSRCLAADEAGYSLFTISDHFLSMSNPSTPSKEGIT